MNIKSLQEQLDMLDECTSIKQLQEYVNNMIEQRGFESETPQDIMLLMTEELGELAKEVRKTTHIKMDVNKSNNLDIKGEIADVFSYLLSMCRVMNIDLLEAFKEKEKINCNRIWK